MNARALPHSRRWILASTTFLMALAVTGLTDAVNPTMTDEPPGRKPSAAAPKAGKPQSVTGAAPERIAELIAVLRATKIGEERRWAIAVRDLVKIGGPAVPPLIDELDQTTGERELRSLGFTLRAIGDRRAVPALIRAIPRTLVEPGSDFGLTIDDAELVAFMHRHDLNPGEGGGLFHFGMPFREITGALHALTGRRFNEEELNFINLSGGPEQHRLQHRLFHRLAERWAGWWEENWRRFTDDPTLAQVRLPPFPEAPPPTAAAAQPFPTGAKVRVAAGWAGVIIGPPQPIPYSRTFQDLDTGRGVKWSDELPAPGKADPNEVAAWAAREGYDLWGVEYRPPGSDRSFYALRGLDLRAWQIDNRRFGTIEQELRGGRPPELGRSAGDLLMDFDPKTGTTHPENEATFLFVTHEGATGVLQVTGLITELFGPNDIGRPAPARTNRGFYRGVQFQYKLIYQEDGIARPERP